MKTSKKKLPQDVLDKFYDLKEYNNIAFEIHDSLSDAFLKCNNCLIKDGYNKYLNLIAVFYPIISKLLVNYCFIKYDILLSNIKSENELKKLVLPNGGKSLWPINYSNVFNLDYKPLGHEYLNTRPSTIAGLIKYYTRNIYKSINNQIDLIYDNKTDQTVYISLNAGITPKRLRSLIDNKVKELYLKKRINIPLWDKQFNLFFRAINKIERKLENLISDDFKFDNNFLSFLKNNIATYCSPNGKNRMNAGILVIGSLADLKCRINAAIAKSNKIPVLSVWHGDNIGEKDEPQFGPVAQTFSDIILGYGDYGCSELHKGKYNKNLYKNPIIYPGSSKNVKKIYKGEKVQIISNIDSSTFMYVPTVFHGVQRVGPFHDMHDLAYCGWQKNMLSQIKKVFNPRRLIRKRHRKEHLDYNFQLDGIDQLYEEDFFNLLDLPDIFIFDYPTTGLAYAAATEKPIIYFDIGLRNLMPNALRSIQDR